MKIANNQLQTFLKQDFLKYKGVFLFGNNRGLILHRSKFLQNRFSESKTREIARIELDYEAIAKTPSILYTEINSPNLFAPDKIIIVNNVGNGISKSLIDILENSDSNCFIILQGFDIISTSATKKHFDSSKNFASLSCYTQSQEEIRNHIYHILTKKEVKLESSEVLTFIAQQLEGDYDTLLSELDKLALLAHSKGELNLLDVKSILTGSRQLEYNDLIKHIIKEDFGALRADLENLISISEGGAIGIVRNLTNYFIKLLKVKTLVNQGKTQEEAMILANVQIFYKYEQDFKLALKKYTMQELTIIFESWVNLEIDCKTRPIDYKVLFEQWALRFIGASSKLT